VFVRFVDTFSQETAMPAEAPRPGSDATAQTPAEAVLPRTPQPMTRGEEWFAANREAFDFWNREIARNGLPFDRYRQF
jgi:hypothetical protein